jgi:hypothetical protein
MTRFFFILGLALASSGCSSINSALRNELTVIPGTGQLRFISFYGPVGIAAKIDSPARAASMPAITLTGESK